MTETTSICSTCLKVVPATVAIGDVVELIKECPEHGVQRSIIEIDPAAYVGMHHPTSDEARQYIDATILNATDRCNQVCRQCYHMPGSDPDPSVDEIVRRAVAGRSENIILMGAEPTVRNDLPDIFRSVPKRTGVYTNLIRFSDMAYLEACIAAGMDFICASLHTKQYNDNEVIWQRKLAALDNVRAISATVHHVSFTMGTMDDLDDVLLLSRNFWDLGWQHRIRIPSAIGRCGDRPFHMSEFLSVFEQRLDRCGWRYRRVHDDDTPYHVNYGVEGKWIRLIRWPSIYEVDLSELTGPPYCQFDDELGEVNFVHGALVAAAKKLRRGRQ